MKSPIGLDTVQSQTLATELNKSLAIFRELLVARCRILGQAVEDGDEGTASLLSDYVQQQEKLVWMLRTYLV